MKAYFIQKSHHDTSKFNIKSRFTFSSFICDNSDILSAKKFMSSTENSRHNRTKIRMDGVEREFFT